MARPTLDLSKLKTREIFAHCLRYHGCHITTVHGAMLAQCPIHNDNHPSMRLYEDGHGHCYACNAHFTSVIDYLGYVYNYNPPKGIIPHLKEIEELEPFIENATTNTYKVQRAPATIKPPQEPDRDVLRINKAIHHFMEAHHNKTRLDDWADGHNILTSTLRLMGAVVFDPVDLTEFLRNAFSWNELEIARLVKRREDGTSWWTFMPRNVPYEIACPLMWKQREIAGFQFRPYNTPDKGPRFISTSSLGVFRSIHYFPLQASAKNVVFLTEGMTDTATLVDRDLYVIGLPGISNSRQLSQLINRDTDLVIAFDKPPSGYNSVEERAAREIASRFPNVWRLYPTLKDWNEMAQFPDTRAEISALTGNGLRIPTAAISMSLLSPERPDA